MHPTGDKQVLILRHDVDLSLEKAAVMAKLEHGIGVRSTYMFMVNSPVYGDIDLAQNADLLYWFTHFGHEIGLHVMLDEEWEDKVETGRVKLEDVIEVPIKVSATGEMERPVRSVSFHCPTKEVIGGDVWFFPLMPGEPELVYTPPLINTYATKLMCCYVSDSAGRWRREPLEALIDTECPVAQLLVHPVWWGDLHMEPQERAYMLFGMLADGLSREKASALDHAFGKMMPSVW